MTFVAEDKMEHWIEKMKDLKIKEFNTVGTSLKYHPDTILNFSVTEEPKQMQNTSTQK